MSINGKTPNQFKKIDYNSNHMFLSFDIVEFYPSITEDLLDRVIEWAKSLTPFLNEILLSLSVHASPFYSMEIHPGLKEVVIRYST